jgi:hypothetical protein
MTLREYIKSLKALVKVNGNLRVTKYGFSGEVIDAPEPEITYTRAKTRNEKRDKYVQFSYETKAEKVIKI